MRTERGQASVELLAALPLLLLIGLFAFQLLAVGHARVLAGSAAEAGALSLAAGGDARAAAREALPGARSVRMRVAVRGGSVRVRLRPPTVLRVLGRHLAVDARAAVARP